MLEVGLSKVIVSKIHKQVHTKAFHKWRTESRNNAQSLNYKACMVN